MKYRTKPTEWKLDKMSNDELIRLALGKLKQRTIREGDKMDEAFNSGKKDEKQRSKFYAIWYAFEALRIFAERKGILVSEPFPKPPIWKAVQVNHKVIFANGTDPMMYIDLTDDTVHHYKEDVSK